MGITNTVDVADYTGDIIITNGTTTTATIHPHYLGSSGDILITTGTGEISWGYIYDEERKIYGNELVDKFLKMKEMSIEEFAKSEFYRSLLNE